jgi:hypothetical protein
MPSARHSATAEGDTEVTPEASTESRKDAAYYCPGCGLRYEYPQKCTGKPESPHPPIEVVSTDELSGDNPTAAPSTENLG